MRQLDYITRARNHYAAAWIAAYWQALCEGRRVSTL
jgi:hypothetical protein